jgi:ribosomal protein S18 acetylase RimI-like enzyme
MNVTIRECRRDDLPSVVRLQRRWERDRITHGFVAATERQLRSSLGSFFLVAERGGSLIGFIVGSRHRSKGLAVLPKRREYLEIDDVYVTPQFRSSGTGGQLLRRLKRIARQKGIRHFLLYSATKDIDRILHFYRKHGFKPWYVQMYI